MKLNLFRKKNKGMPDLLNYASIVDPGIVLGKNGCLIAGYYYKGEDLDSLTPVERNSISARLNNALMRLDTGWTIQTEAIRISSVGYPDERDLSFDDSVNKLIDEERRESYEKEHEHYETIYAFTLSYLPPMLIQTKLSEYVYEKKGEENRKNISLAQKLLDDFNHWLSEFESSIGDIVFLQRMGAYSVTDEHGQVFHRDQLLDYLNFCIFGEMHPINLSPEIIFLDSVLGAHTLIGGVEPMLDEKNIICISIDGFPSDSYPGILSAIDSLPVPYRWSNRFIYMDAEDSRKVINKYRRKWAQKKRGLTDQVLNTGKGPVDQDAVNMVDETDNALSDISSQSVAFGFYTSVIVITSENSRNDLYEMARNIVRMIRNIGFGARIEDINTIEAWLGTLAGHEYLNIRRPLIHTMNLADFLPVSSVWAGRVTIPNEMYPKNSPALIYANTEGSTTFRFNVHVGDLGHFLVFGPTGSGKSTFLALIASQFTKYKGSTFTSFDKGYSIYALTKACGGNHYDIAGDGDYLQFAPLSNIASDSEQTWCADWIATCCELQLNKKLIPSEKSEINRAMGLHRKSGSKTITELISMIQNEDLREALEHYSIDGNMGHLLDADSDNLSLSRFQAFELEHLMGYKDEDKLPVLLYLFHRIEKMLSGQPAMILLDEAWLMLGHPVFRDKIRDWLKVMRKNNCVIGMATQSLSDAENSGILDVLIESCPTKVYLPNAEAKTDATKKFYERVGLNQTQIDILSMAIPKRQYYCVSWEGRRLFDLDLGPVALAFVGKSGKKDKKDVDAFISEYSDSWSNEWLKLQGVNQM